MAKALIVYATRTGATEKIGALLAEGIRIAGHQASVVAVNEIKKEADLEGYDAVVFGSPTYHGDMMQKMKTLLFLAEKVNLEGKIGGAFGAFEWSGEAPGRICDTMENIFKMDMAAGPLMLKSADLGGGLQMAHEYGKKIAAKM